MEKMEEDNFGYSDEVLDLLERLRINCVNMNQYHRQRYFYFKAYGKWFRIPIILLSIIAGASSVGLQSLEVDQKVISGVTCIISLVIAMLSALELHLSINDKLEDSYKYCKTFYSLSTDLYKTIKLKPEERSERGGDYLGRMFTEYTKLCESSEMMSHAMRNDVLMRIPKDLVEYKRTPIGTPDASLDEDVQQIFNHFPHSTSVVFQKPGSPTLKKQYYGPALDELEELKDSMVNVTEVEEKSDDVESNLSK